MDQYQQFIHKSRYAKYLDEEGRRETWEETVERYIQFFVQREQLPKKGKVTDDLRKAITNLDIMPSMRCMMTAGEALERDNVAGFNCAYLAIDNPRAFDELMYILMCGTGVGFSVEREGVSKLPPVAEELHETETTIVVSDSKIGWASSFRELVSLLYSGKIPRCDLSRVRPAGARLKTFGGRASGPKPLSDLFNFSVELFKGATGRKLTTLECHDLVCKIADIVVVGGVRRSALISLSNVTDQRMQTAKTGAWWETNGQRALANNSAVYTDKPDYQTFFAEMKSLYDSKSGERGIFSREASKKIVARNGRRDPDFDFGTNPCSEIILRPSQFCNLSEVVARPTDTLEDLERKVELATILGTLQSSLVDFRYLRAVWKRNTEEECLLGVSMTGIMDHPILGDASSPEVAGMLTALKNKAIKTNTLWAKYIGVNPSTAITAVKPSGTVSQLVNSASGIHPRFSPYYIRTVRADRKDPLAQAMKDAGFQCEDDVTNSTNLVFSFPIKSHSEARTVDDIDVMEQLELWKVYQDHWCEHKPSMTAYYNDGNFFAAAQWLWTNFDDVSGVSFLPEAEHIYQQAPYQKITQEQYDVSVALQPVGFDWNIVENEDNTVSSQTLACVSGVCEI
tara:strand:+ start:803 stop:2677 length:1875 start_codon:yes stop_codon:yes gene_type:complete